MFLCDSTRMQMPTHDNNTRNARARTYGLHFLLCWHIQCRTTSAPVTQFTYMIWHICFANGSRLSERQQWKLIRSQSFWTEGRENSIKLECFNSLESISIENVLNVINQNRFDVSTHASKLIGLLRCVILIVSIVCKWIWIPSQFTSTCELRTWHKIGTQIKIYWNRFHFIE